MRAIESVRFPRRLTRLLSRAAQRLIIAFLLDREHARVAVVVYGDRSTELVLVEHLRPSTSFSSFAIVLLIFSAMMSGVGHINVRLVAVTRGQQEHLGSQHEVFALYCASCASP
jgi:hypothetical protein